MPKVGILLRTRNISHIKIAKTLSKEFNAPIVKDVTINDVTDYDIIITDK